MVLTLYGFPFSTCTKRVAVVLHEKKVPFKYVNIDLATGEHKRPEVLEKQPFGQVPYIEDDGFVLYESRAIARYIATKYAGQGTAGLVPPPTDIQASAKLDQALSIEVANYDVYAAKAIYEGVIKKKFYGAADEAAAKAAIDSLSPKLDVYEKILLKQKYLAGDELTIVDLFHLPTGTLLPFLGLDTLDNAARPNVARWWKELQERQAWLAIKDDIASVETY